MDVDDARRRRAWASTDVMDIAEVSSSIFIGNRWNEVAFDWQLERSVGSLRLKSVV